MPMSDRLTARRRRLAASGAVAVVSVVIAAVMHAIMGGGTPSIVAVALALLASGAIGLLVVGPRLGRRRAAAGVLLDQAVFHTLFAFFGPSASEAAGSLGSHDAHGMPVHGLADTAVFAPAVAAPLASMIVGHLAAALVAYALLRRGAAALESITVALATALAKLLEPAAAAATLPSPLRLAPNRSTELAAHDPLLRLPERRGPPVLAAV